jgi:hypothetical protein
MVHASKCRDLPPFVRIGEIDAALCPASAALDFKEAISSVHRLIDQRAGVDRPAVCPHPFVPALAGVAVGLADHLLALLAKLSGSAGKHVGHRPRLAQLFGEGLAIPARQGGTWCLGDIGRGYRRAKRLRKARGDNVRGFKPQFRFSIFLFWRLRTKRANVP